MSNDTKYAYPEEPLRCCSYNCVVEQNNGTRDISHNQPAVLGFDANGELVQQAAMHTQCYRKYGPGNKTDGNTNRYQNLKRYDEVRKGRIDKRIVRYEISPEHTNFDMSCISGLNKMRKKYASQATQHIDSIESYDNALEQAAEHIKDEKGVYIHPQILNNQAIRMMQQEMDATPPTKMIGEIVGEVETSYFTFVSYKEVKKFDYVAVNPDNIGHTLLAQVKNVTKFQNGRCEAKAHIIGYRNGDGLLKHPRTTMNPDNYVYLATQELVSHTLDLDTGGLDLGVMENDENLHVYLDPDDLLQHLAILAKTGAGKSYALGCTIEEMLDNGLPVVVIDPHGEYSQMKRPNNSLDDDDKDKYNIAEAKGYDVKQYSVQQHVDDGDYRLEFSSKNIDYDTFTSYCLDEMTGPQKREIKKVIDDLQEQHHNTGSDYGLVDVEDRVMEADMPSKTKQLLIEYINKMRKAGLYSHDPARYTTPSDIVEPGTLTVLNLKGPDPGIQQHVVKLVTKKLFNERKKEAQSNIPPFIIAYEEAHNFVPNNKRKGTLCEHVIRTVASEGRKFGMGLGIVSQRPSKVSSDVLSQCNTQVILKVQNPTDLQAIKSSFENVDDEIIERITGLPTGIGVTLTKEYPLMTDIRTRKSEHGGTGHSFDTITS